MTRVVADLPIIGPIIKGFSNFVGGAASKAVKTGFRWMVEFVIGETQEDVEAELREFLENVAPKVHEMVAAGRGSL